MTKEKAIKTLKENYCAMCAYGSQDMDSCDISYCDNKEAIKALEQEPVLDKIRAEVERLQKMCDKDDLNLMAQYSAFGMVLDILDKYKSESESE